MTENEAKIFIQNAMEQSKNVLAELMLIMPKVFAVRKKSLGEYYSNLENCKKEIQSCEVAIKALKEVQQYRAIGTPEECRAAVEKQTAKKVKSISQVKDGDSYVGLIGRCPCCEDILEEGTVYCDCGQKLDWNTDTVADQEDTEARR